MILKYFVVALLTSSISLNYAIENVTFQPDISLQTESKRTKSDDNIIMDDLKLIESWKEIIRGAKTGIQSLLKNALPIFIGLTSKATMSPECQGSFLNMIIGLGSMKKWPFIMLDASGKIPSGLISGSTTDFGDYDLCLNINVKEKSAFQDKVTGMYCTAIITPKLPKKLQLDFVNMTLPNTIFATFQEKVKYFDLTKFRTGMCVPSTCDKEDIQSLLSSVVDGYPFDVEVPNCEVKRGIELMWHQLTVLSCFAVLLIVLILGTGIDLFLPASCINGILAILRIFSLYTNGKQFLETEVKTSKLKALYGIKVLSMFWIILVHTYVYNVRFSLNQSSNVLEHLKDPFFGILINSFCSVDTFFVISGLLVSYLTMMYMETTKGRLNLLAFYFRRWWRLTPCLLFLLGMVTLFPLMGSGPLWNELVTREVDVCNRNWWTTLLFITSWLDYFDMCLVHTWFVSVDFHYYLMSPFLLFIFYNRPKTGISINCAIILGSIVTAAILVFKHNSFVFFPLNTEDFLNYHLWMHTNYYKPYSHLSTYFTGFLLGILFYKRSEIKLKPVYVIVGWTLSTFAALSILLGTYSWINGTNPTLVEMIAFRSLYRTGWALSISWIIAACYYGYGGYVNALLSWKLFVPLNRLVYLMYLTHFPMQWIRTGSKKHTVPLDHIEAIYEFFGHLVVTIGISAFVYITIEGPFASLSTLILDRIMIKSPPKSILENITIDNTIIKSSILEKSPAKNTIEEEGSAAVVNILRQKIRSSDEITRKISATKMTMIPRESNPTAEEEKQLNTKEEIIRL